MDFADVDLINFFVEYGGWSWIVAGLAFLALEIFVSGSFLVWMGAAGLVTGLLVFRFTGIAPPLQFAIFGVLSIVGILIWFNVRDRFSKPADNEMLNQRAARLVGERGLLSEPIVGMQGRMEIQGSVWRVTGPELPVGQLVEVVGVQGSVLSVISADDVGRQETA